MIELSSLKTGYGTQEILHGISLSVNKGEITTLIGPNGCGKSTLLKVLTGMLPVRDGSIRIDSLSISELSETQLAKKIAYLPQTKDTPDISAGRMVLHGRFPYLSYPRKYSAADYAAAQAAMEKMGIADLADTPLKELSGGTRQKVYIAMALCRQAEIILLDEPATYLDISQQLRLSDILRSLADSGITVFTVSHDIIHALKASDRIAVMQQGCVKAYGTAEEILSRRVIPEVFGVDVASLEINGAKEYFYTRKEERK